MGYKSQIFLTKKAIPKQVIQGASLKQLTQI